MSRVVILLSLIACVAGTPNYDRNLHCAEWAKADNECSKNPRYMWSSCLTSCVMNTVDTDPECQEYAEQGECTKNPEYVHIHCPHACSLGIAWNPWTRYQLGISPVEYDDTLAHEACKSPIDLFSAAEIMKNRVVKYMNGGHNSVKGLVSTAPSEYLGMLGLVEAILYTLRLHQVILTRQSENEVVSKVNDRHNAVKSNFLFIQNIEQVLSRGYESDLLMRKMPDFLSYLTDSSEAVHTILDISEEEAELGACTTPRGPALHHLTSHFRNISLSDAEVNVAGSVASTTTTTAAAAATAVPTVRLLNGLSMPALGLGTWQLEGSSATEAVYQAIKVGYRLFDTAQAYRNEAEVGEGIRRAISEGLVTREELFICTKLSSPENAGYKKVRELVSTQLSLLGLDYIDLYMLHSPLDARVQAQTWKALEDLHSEGVLKSLGVSNFDSSELQQLISSATVKPVSVQNKVDIYHYGKQLDNQGDNLVKYAASEGVAVQAYSPFSAYPFMMTPLEDPVVKAIAARLSLTPAQVLIKWTIQHGLVALPRSSSPENLRSNYAALAAAPLTSADMAVIDTLQYLVKSPVSKTVEM